MHLHCHNNFVQGSVGCMQHAVLQRVYNIVREAAALQLQCCSRMIGRQVLRRVHAGQSLACQRGHAHHASSGN